MQGYRFWQATGAYHNVEKGEIESVEMEFELAFPIDDEWGRIYLQDFLRMNPLIWEGKHILFGSVFVMSKAARRATFTIK